MLSSANPILGQRYPAVGRLKHPAVSKTTEEAIYKPLTDPKTKQHKPANFPGTPIGNFKKRQPIHGQACTKRDHQADNSINQATHGDNFAEGIVIGVIIRRSRSSQIYQAISGIAHYNQDVDILIGIA